MRSTFLSKDQSALESSEEAAAAAMAAAMAVMTAATAMAATAMAATVMAAENCWQQTMQRVITATRGGGGDHFSNHIWMFFYNAYLEAPPLLKTKMETGISVND